MRYYKIEVDEEVWNFLKGKAEPFEDTPNTVLRSILFGSGHVSISATKLADQRRSQLDLPPGIPKALSQILEVIYEVKDGRVIHKPEPRCMI